MRRRIIPIIIAFVMVIAFSTTAFAISKEYDFSATTCYSGFTTSGYATKGSDETWTGTYIMPTSIQFSPSLPSGNAVKLRACLIGESSVVLGSTIDATTASTSAYNGCYALPTYSVSTRNSHNTLRARIYNPYGSPYNMICSGYCVFETSGGGK